MNKYTSNINANIVDGISCSIDMSNLFQHCLTSICLLASSLDPRAENEF